MAISDRLNATSIPRVGHQFFTKNEQLTVDIAAARVHLYSGLPLGENFCKDKYGVMEDLKVALARNAKVSLPGKWRINTLTEGEWFIFRNFFVDELNGLIAHHHGLQFACLEHDGWNGPDGEPVLGMALTYRNEKFVPRRAALGLGDAAESHSGATLSRIAQDRLEDAYGLDLSLIVDCTISDTAANALKASDLIMASLDGSEEADSGDIVNTRDLFIVVQTRNLGLMVAEDTLAKALRVVISRAYNDEVVQPGDLLRQLASGEGRARNVHSVSTLASLKGWMEMYNPPYLVVEVYLSFDDML